MKNRKFKLRGSMIIFLSALTSLAYGQTIGQYNTDDKQLIVDKLQTIGKDLYVIIFAIAGVVAVWGGFKVYNNFISETRDEDNKVLKRWISALIFLIFLGIIIRMFTGMDFRNE